MLKIHEGSSTEGELAAVFLSFDAGLLQIESGAGAYSLPEAVLATVMQRYGAPFDPEAPITLVATLALGAGSELRHVRHLAGYDVIARDYLVHHAPGREPLCALSITVAAALVHLGKVSRAADHP